MSEKKIKIISTIHNNQEELIKSIINLYCPQGIECDPTYSKGVFYKNILAPKYKFDIAPQTEDTIKVDCRNLPLTDNMINSIMFDPPFVGGSRKNGKPGIIKTRFGYYKNIPSLWKFYSEALVEFYRILFPEGILVFKCQDTVESGKQWMSHCFIMNKAIEIGFYPRDLFILIANNRLISPNMLNQKHARKYHSYFWVFEKTKCKVNYEI